MKDKKQTIALIVVGILLVVSVGGGFLKPYLSNQNKPSVPSNGSSSSENGEKERYPVPDFKFTDLEENDVNFSDFKGKPIVLNFWATWCPFCIEEMADFDRLIGEYGDKVNFIMMDALDGKRETVAIVKKFLDEQKYDHLVPHLDKYSEALTTFGVTNFPTTVFIDKEGNMFSAVIGKTNYATVKEVLDKELGE